MRYLRLVSLYSHPSGVEAFRVASAEIFARLKINVGGGVEISKAFKLLILYLSGSEGVEITQPFLSYFKDTQSLELRLIILLFYLRIPKRVSYSYSRRRKHIYQVYLMFPRSNLHSVLRVVRHATSVNVSIDIDSLRACFTRLRSSKISRTFVSLWNFL